MKAFVLGLSSLLIGSAHASYYQDSCSNAEATARWAEGHSEHGAFFRGTDDRGQWFTVELDPRKLNIVLKNKKLLKKKIEGGEDWSSTQKWFSVEATITPEPEVAEEFKKVFPEGKLTEFVICTNIIS